MFKSLSRIIYILFISTSLINISCRAKKNSTVSFERIYGGVSTDYGRAVYETKDGNYLLLGETRKFKTGTDDIVLIKTALNGEAVWRKTFGGNGDDQGRAVQELSDGSIMLFGSAYSFNGGDWDMHLIKTDSAGKELWNKKYGSDKSEKGFSAQQTSDGGFIMLGFTDSFGAGGLDVFLLKADENGKELWSKTFGGKGNDYGYSVRQTADGGYILAGKTASFGTGWDTYLIKTDALGDELWSKTLGIDGDDYGNAVLQTSDGGFVVLGSAWDKKSGTWGARLVKTDATGAIEWVRGYGTDNDDFGASLEQTSDGGYALLGWTKTYGKNNNLCDIYLVKTDMDGKELWDKTFGEKMADERGLSLKEITGGGYVLLGYAVYSGPQEVDMLFIKTDSDGNL